MTSMVFIATKTVKKVMKVIFFSFVLMIFLQSEILAQVTGGEIPDFRPDSTIIFQSPRPLYTLEELSKVLIFGAGGGMVLSNSGFAVGLFWQYELNENSQLNLDLYMSGARNADEWQRWDPISQTMLVKGKINRVYNFPLTLGYQHFLFSDVIADSFKPFLGLGGGGSLIMTTPYSKRFFAALGDLEAMIRPAGYLSLGADFGGSVNRILRLEARYYYIPIGGDGVASLHPDRIDPMVNIQGLFLSLSFGVKY